MKRLGVALVLLLALLMSVLGAGASHAAVDQPPDLRMRKPSGFYIQTAGTERRLRFTTVVANYGPGVFHVRADRPNTATARMSVVQRVAQDDGSPRTVLTDSYAFWGGDGHEHWHIDRLQEFTIRRVDDNDSGVTGPIVGRGAKIGFCFYDNTKINLALPGAPQAPRYTGCGVKTALGVTMGLSVGWGDTYGANLNYQWIKINGLKDGKYRIHVTADPRNQFVEGNETNNRSFTTIRIRGNAVTVLG